MRPAVAVDALRDHRRGNDSACCRRVCTCGLVQAMAARVRRRRRPGCPVRRLARSLIQAYKSHMAAAQTSTRARLIRSGTRLARQSGLRALTVRGVCDAAGANTGTFVYHFGTRDAFVAELIVLPAANPGHVQPTDFGQADRLVDAALQASRAALGPRAVSRRVAA